MTILMGVAFDVLLLLICKLKTDLIYSWFVPISNMPLKRLHTTAINVGNNEEETWINFCLQENILKNISARLESWDILPSWSPGHCSMFWQRSMSGITRWRKVNKLKIFHWPDLINWHIVIAEFADWLLPMLSYDPSERASALDCINHPFMADV